MKATIERGTGQGGGLSAVWGSARRRWWLVLGAAVAGAVVFGVLVNHMTPIYRGTTILAPADLDKKSMGSGLGSALGSVSGFAALAGIGFGGNDYATEEAMEVLKSQELSESYIRANDLMPALFPDVWDPAKGGWKAGKKVPTVGAGYRRFDKMRKVTRDKVSGLITLRVDWRKDPVMAANIANGLVALLNDEMRQRALVQAEASVGYLQQEMTTTADVSTHEAISHLMEDQIKQQMLAHVTKQYSLQIVDAAIPADLDAPVSPIKILYIAVGFMLGAGAGAFVALKLDKRAATAA